MLPNCDWQYRGSTMFIIVIKRLSGSRSFFKICFSFLSHPCLFPDKRFLQLFFLSQYDSSSAHKCQTETASDEPVNQEYNRFSAQKPKCQLIGAWTFDVSSKLMPLVFYTAGCWNKRVCVHSVLLLPLSVIAGLRSGNVCKIHGGCDVSAADFISCCEWWKKQVHMIRL